jgi:hypothetical protein
MVTHILLRAARAGCSGKNLVLGARLERIGGNAPAGFLAFVPLLEPGQERSIIFDQRRGIGFVLACQSSHGFRPGFGASELKHGAELGAGFFRFVERAAMERPAVARRLAQSAVELELVNARKELARIGSVVGNVIFSARIEIRFATIHRRRHALVLLPQCPPRPVVIGGFHLARENFPAPFVDQ